MDPRSLCECESPEQVGTLKPPTYHNFWTDKINAAAHIIWPILKETMARSKTPGLVIHKFTVGGQDMRRSVVTIANQAKFHGTIWLPEQGEVTSLYPQCVIHQDVLEGSLQTVRRDAAALAAYGLSDYFKSADYADLTILGSAHSTNNQSLCLGGVNGVGTTLVAQRIPDVNTQSLRNGNIVVTFGSPTKVPFQKTVLKPSHRGQLLIIKQTTTRVLRLSTATIDVVCTYDKHDRLLRRKAETRSDLAYPMDCITSRYRYSRDGRKCREETISVPGVGFAQTTNRYHRFAEPRYAPDFDDHGDTPVPVFSRSDVVFNGLTVSTSTTTNRKQKNGDVRSISISNTNPRVETVYRHGIVISSKIGEQRSTVCRGAAGKPFTVTKLGLSPDEPQVISITHHAADGKLLAWGYYDDQRKKFVDAMCVVYDAQGGVESVITDPEVIELEYQIL